MISPGTISTTAMLSRPAAQHIDVRRDHIADGGECILALAFLDKTDDRVDDDDSLDHGGINDMAQKPRRRLSKISCSYGVCRPLIGVNAAVCRFH